MAEPRNRVWLARLILGGAVAAVILVGLFYASFVFYLSAPDDQEKSKGDLQPVPVQSASDAPLPPHALDPVLEMAGKALALHRSRDRDYTATMVKRFRLGGKLTVPEVMKLKVRSRDRQPGADRELDPRPIDVYLGFLEPKSLAGREVIWREGFNDDKITVHEAGFLNLARVQLAPSSPLAMMGNRYPISDLGIERLLIKFIERGNRDRLIGDCEIRIREDFEFEGRLCRRIEVFHTEKTAEVNGKMVEYDFSRAEIDVDLEYEIPIHYAAYIWPDQEGGEPLLDEEFTYRELRLNCDLNDMDFDPDNPEYRYPAR